MARVWLFTLLFVAVVAEDNGHNMDELEKRQLREEAREMFYHAYNSYMDVAYPADELMPLSCKGRYRGVTPNRGDMDDILGNFSLTLVDSLDTLVILGDFEEFDHAVKLIIKDVTFDQDIVVSVFETNIRMLGGLLSAHLLALQLQQESQLLTWYRGELLTLAHDLGRRLLPAFNTSTGIPHGRVNLRHGLKGIFDLGETCTACAGTMILEMAALSRLTGEPIFEQKAHWAMDRLWKIRHRNSDLMGTVLNVHSGDWVRKDSGVGAGIDSYYEYCLKAYILLGDERYLARFNKHYNAVMKYISRGPMMLDVHMHRPHLQSRNFMDALLAFWPGLQVLLGDVRPAVETHEMLYQVMQRHTFIPEAFTADFQVHWGQHPLRPEFLESTYFLHRATGDDHYLRVGKAALKALQKYTWVPCGYAAVNDVRTRIHEDRMDSFVLAETFKYLYMLFSNDVDLPVRLDDYILTTEAHFLPLSLAGLYKNNSYSDADDIDAEYSKYSRTCPNTAKMLPENVRKPLKDMVGELRNGEGKFSAKYFKPGDPQHIQALADIGISVITLNDGRVQLLYTYSTAKTPKEGEQGITFMREMAELLDRTGTNLPSVTHVKSVLLMTPDKPTLFTAGPSHFGIDLKEKEVITGLVKYADPLQACTSFLNADDLQGKIVIAERGDCTFANKVRQIQQVGGVAAIIVDNVSGTSSTNSPLFAMSGDGTDDISIASVFIFSNDAEILKNEVLKNPLLEVSIGENSSLKELMTEKTEKSEKDKGVYVKVGDFLAHAGSKETYVTVSYQPGEPNRRNFHADVGKSVFVGHNSDTKELQNSPTEWFDKLTTNPNKKLHLPVDLLKELYNVLEKSEANSMDQTRLLSWLLSTLEREKDSSSSKPTIISTPQKVHMVKSATSVKSEEFVISTAIDQQETNILKNPKAMEEQETNDDDIIQSKPLRQIIKMTSKGDRP